MPVQVLFAWIKLNPTSYQVLLSPRFGFADEERAVVHRDRHRCRQRRFNDPIRIVPGYGDRIESDAIVGRAAQTVDRGASVLVENELNVSHRSGRKTQWNVSIVKPDLLRAGADLSVSGRRCRRSRRCKPMRYW